MCRFKAEWVAGAMANPTPRVPQTPSEPMQTLSCSQTLWEAGLDLCCADSILMLQGFDPWALQCF